MTNIGSQLLGGIKKEPENKAWSSWKGLLDTGGKDKLPEEKAKSPDAIYFTKRNSV